MRRRLIITALVVDGLLGLGGLAIAPSVLAAEGEPAQATPEMQATYVKIGDVCVQQDDVDGAEMGGWTVDDAFCTQS